MQPTLKLSSISSCGQDYQVIRMLLVINFYGMLQYRMLTSIIHLSMIDIGVVVMHLVQFCCKKDNIMHNYLHGLSNMVCLFVILNLEPISRT